MIVGKKKELRELVDYIQVLTRCGPTNPMEVAFVDDWLYEVVDCEAESLDDIHGVRFFIIPEDSCFISDLVNDPNGKHYCIEESNLFLAEGLTASEALHFMRQGPWSPDDHHLLYETDVPQASTIVSKTLRDHFVEIKRDKLNDKIRLEREALEQKAMQRLEDLATLKRLANKYPEWK